MWTDAAILCAGFAVLGVVMISVREFQERALYRVVLSIEGKRVTHRAMTESEAFDWVRQYPEGITDGPIQIFQGNHCIAVRP